MCTCKLIYLICRFLSLAPNYLNIVPHLYFKEVKKKINFKQQECQLLKEQTPGTHPIGAAAVGVGLLGVKKWQNAERQANDRGQ